MSHLFLSLKSSFTPTHIVPHLIFTCDSEILLYESPTMVWEPSSVYRFDDMVAALRVMYTNGVANKYFYMGDETENGPIYGLVNIAAFLAQSMKETIKYNA